MEDITAPVDLVAPAHPARTSFSLSPSVLPLCPLSSHRLPWLIFQLVVADLYLNPNICPIQCELCIQPNAWLCLCPLERTEWATWLGNADIAWSLVAFLRIDQMQQGRRGEKRGLCSASLPCSHGEESELVSFQSIIINCPLFSQMNPWSVWIKRASNQRMWLPQRLTVSFTH